MYFKLDYILRPIQIGELDFLRLEIDTKLGKVNIEIDKGQEEDSRRGIQKGDYGCVAIMERRERLGTEVLFVAMNEDVLHGIKKLIDDVRSELGRCIHCTIENIKWTRGIIWMHDRVRFGSGLKWSLDGEVWKQVPNEIHFDIWHGLAERRQMKEEEIALIKDNVEAGIVEPLGHTILSEAYSQRTNSPRSSLVMGIAAAEIGWKQFVATMLPQTKWLVENVPSPPIEKMLKDLLPLIPVRLKVQGKKVEIPERVVGLLKKGVNLRNKTIHAGDQALSRIALEEILLAVRDLLYLLDLYSGLSWALKNISTETQNNLSADD